MILNILKYFDQINQTRKFIHNYESENVSILPYCILLTHILQPLSNNWFCFFFFHILTQKISTILQDATLFALIIHVTLF